MTHKQPYGNIKHTTEVVIKTARGEPPERPTEQDVLKRGLDDNLWELLTSCWSSSPSRRPQINKLLESLP